MLRSGIPHPKRGQNSVILTRNEKDRDTRVTFALMIVFISQIIYTQLRDSDTHLANQNTLYVKTDRNAPMTLRVFIANNIKT